MIAKSITRQVKIPAVMCHETDKDKLN